MSETKLCPGPNDGHKHQHKWNVIEGYCHKHPKAVDDLLWCESCGALSEGKMFQLPTHSARRLKKSFF